MLLLPRNLGRIALWLLWPSASALAQPTPANSLALAGVLQPIPVLLEGVNRATDAKSDTYFRRLHPITQVVVPPVDISKRFTSDRCESILHRPVDQNEAFGNVSVFPNPADGYGFNVQVFSPDLVAPTLLNKQGQAMPIRYRTICDAQMEIMPKTRLSAGVYKLIIRKGEVSRQLKVMIR